MRVIYLQHVKSRCVVCVSSHKRKFYLLRKDKRKTIDYRRYVASCEQNFAYLIKKDHNLFSY